VARALKCCGLLPGPRAAGSTFRRHVALEISSRNSPVAAIQKRWDRLRARLDLILDQTKRGHASVPPVPFGRARDQPDGCGPHPPRGERPGVEPGCASTCRPTFPIKLERTSRGGTEARLADTSSRHTRSRTAARRCRATRCRRRCADRASRGARLFHPHPSSEPK
jgi:hypothetical protein